MEFLIPIGQLWKKSFEAYKTKVKTLAGIALVNLVCIPFFLLVSALIGYVVIAHGQGRWVSISWYLLIALTILIAILAGMIVNSWTMASMLLAVRGTATTAKEALRLGWAKLPSFLWICFLLGLAAVLGFVLLIIPGIIFSVWFSFAVYIYIFEDTKGTNALKASKALVSGRFWAVFGRLLLMWLVFVAVGMIFKNFFGQLINMFITTPFSLVYMYLVYEDLKKVKSSPTVTQ